MNKIVTVIIAFSFLLGGCNFTDKTYSRTVPVNEYKGQGFKLAATKEAKSLVKTHRDEYADLAKRYFKDNFGLNVKVTNVVAHNDGAEIFVHCDDHGIIFDSSTYFNATMLGYKGPLLAKKDTSRLRMQIARVLGGCNYRANKKQFDELYQYFKKNQKKYGYSGYSKEAILKTQDSGHHNEFFYLKGLPITFTEYREKIYPLITENDETFSKKYNAVMTPPNEEIYFEISTNLLSNSDHYNQKEMQATLKKMSQELENLPSRKNVRINLIGSSNEIFTHSGKYNTDPDHMVEITMYTHN